MKSVHIERAREAAQKLLAAADYRTSNEYKEELLLKALSLAESLLAVVRAENDKEDDSHGTDEE